MSVIVWIGWAVFMALVFRFAYRDAADADRRDALERRYGPFEW